MINFKIYLMSAFTAAILTIGLLSAPLPASAADAETETIAGCAATSADPLSFATCTAGILTANEAEKCFATKFEDCFGRGNTFRQIIDRNLVGPAQDIIDGEFGRSDKSVWRQLGLPRVRLW